MQSATLSRSMSHAPPSQPPPESRDEIRQLVSPRRWRVFESIEQILAEAEEQVDWEKIYDCDAELAVYAAWGLFLEELIPDAGERIRAVSAEPLPSDAQPSDSQAGDDEELEDHLHWGTKQIENGIQQSLAVLSRHVVTCLTAGEVSDSDALRERRRAVCIPLAEVAGKLRSDLRRFASFVVADNLWDPNDVELVLFPQRLQELAKSQSLKSRLVATMESFQGTDDRLPIADVLKMWRAGKVMGPAALAEVDLLIESLHKMLVADDRKSLYADSYYRLVDWWERLVACSQGLKERLGDESVEKHLIREIAAVLDTDILVDLLGEEWLGDPESDEMPETADLLQPLTRRELEKVDMPKPQRRRLVELRKTVSEGKSLGTLVDLRDVQIVQTAAAKIHGRRMVDGLRFRNLPTEVLHLRHLQPIVRTSEDGLKTYLMLLYGQIQNRNLHLLKTDEKEVSMVEKRLAVLEMRYQLSRIGKTKRYKAFEDVRAAVAQGAFVNGDDWSRMLRFLKILSREVLPRVERIAAFTEGVPEESAARIVNAINELEPLEEGPSTELRSAVGEALETLASILSALQTVEVAIAPPETEAELEDFLNMLG